jgi:WD40 repeat protein
MKTVMRLAFMVIVGLLGHTAIRAQDADDPWVAAGLLSEEQSETKKALQEAEAQRKRAEEQQQRAEEFRKQAEVLSARVALERGLSLYELNKPAESMLWLTRAFQLAPDHAPDLKLTIRRNLGGYRPVLFPLKFAFAHDGPVWYVAFSPNGDLVATASNDGMARLWDARTGMPIGKPLRHQDVVVTVAFHPDGRTLLTSSFDGTAQIWDVRTQQPTAPALKHKGRVVLAWFSPDGNMIVTGSEDKTARLWDGRTGKPIREPLPHNGNAHVAAFSPNSEMVVTGAGEGDGSVRVWDTRTGKLVGKVLGPFAPVVSVDFSPDNRLVASGHYGGAVEIWDVQTSNQVAMLNHRDTAQVVAFSPDGKTLLTGSHDRTAQLWRTDSWKPLGKPMLHQGQVWAGTFLKKGRVVATGSWDGSAALWDASTGEPIGEAMSQGPVIVLAASADGQQLMTACQDNSARLWTIAEVLPDKAGLAGTDDPASIRRLINVGFSTVHRNNFSLSWWTATQEWFTKPVERAPVNGWTMAYSQDGELACAATPGRPVIWQPRSGKRMLELPHDGEIDTVAFSRDGKIVVTGGADRKARLWDTQSGKPVCNPLPHRGKVTAAVFSPDGRSVATAEHAGTEASVQIWDVKTGDPLGKPLPYYPAGRIEALAISPDGKALAMGGIANWVHLRELPAGRLLGRIKHQGAVNSVAFSPDANMLVTASDDFTARLWEVRTGKPIGMPLRHPSQVQSATFSENGKSVLTGNRDGVRHWHVASPAEGSAKRIVLWAQVLTGMELDAAEEVQILNAREWQARRQRLEELGGSPVPDFADPSKESSKGSQGKFERTNNK